MRYYIKHEDSIFNIYENNGYITLVKTNQIFPEFETRDNSLLEKKFIKSSIDKFVNIYTYFSFTDKLYVVRIVDNKVSGKINYYNVEIEYNKNYNLGNEIECELEPMEGFPMFGEEPLIK